MRSGRLHRFLSYIQKSDAGGAVLSNGRTPNIMMSFERVRAVYKRFGVGLEGSFFPWEQVDAASSLIPGGGMLGLHLQLLGKQWEQTHQ